MIRLDNVTKEYDLPPGQPGQLVAAARLTMEVAAGEVFGLVGPNGAGKTTTLKMICGLMLPTAGRITVNNIDVEQEPEEAQQYIGYLADFFSVYDDLKTWEYVEHFARAYKLDPSKIPARVPFTAFFLPSAVYLLDHSAWVQRPVIWAAAIVAQWFLVAVFIRLQKQTINDLNAAGEAPAASPLPAQT